jgi:arylsulfatase A
LTDLSDILPTLVDFAGASLPTRYAIDGKSLKPFLTGQTDTHREWIFSNIATSRLLRTQRYLLEAVNPMLNMPEGRLYDCENSRDGRAYRRISDPEERTRVLSAFQPILDKYPALTEDHPFWTSKRGKPFLKAYTAPAAIAKHLHNHKDYQFYDEE